MKLSTRLTLRYAVAAVACLVLLAGLAYHELVVEPRMRASLGIVPLPESIWGEIAEVVFYALIPLVLGLGWWLMRRSLRPIDELARRVDRIGLENLGQPIPRTGRGDEIDRLTDVFNAMSSRLEDSFARIREFSLQASHELKTPLTVMRGQLDGALDHAEKHDPARAGWIHAQIDEVDRLARIVDGLTLLAKADTGQVPMERQPVRLDQLVRECAEDAVILAHPKAIGVTLGRCDAAEVAGDRARLRQLLLNLADNAIKYNRDGGKVEIELRFENGWAALEIRNTGDPLPPGLERSAFDPFARGEAVRAKGIDGCGLGLAIAHWIVGSHGGEISLRNGPPGWITARARFPAKPVDEEKLIHG